MSQQGFALQQEYGHHNIHQYIQYKSHHQTQYQHRIDHMARLQGRIIPEQPGEHKTYIANKGYPAEK